VLLLNDEEKREQRDLAKLEYTRSIWPDETIDEILQEVMSGSMVITAIKKFAPIALEKPIPSFYNLLGNDDVLMDKYRTAREIQMWGFADDILEIADDASQDLIDGPKGTMVSNPSAVRRSETKVRARQYLMERLHSKSFGNKIQNEHKVELIDHAKTLDAARRRSADKAQKQREALTNGKAPVTIEQVIPEINEDEPGE